MAAFSSVPAAAALENEIRRRFGVRHVRFASTGRAAMTVLLRAMARLAPARNEVIVPSYTCYSVAASVVKAGLRPRIVDITPETLDYDYAALERADFTRVLAVIATNLYGIPNDLPSLSAVARRNGAFVIDDAAQAMGATWAGRLAGTTGDAGLFSFDKGKNVSAIDGGVLVTNSEEMAAALDAEMAGLDAPRRADSAVHVVKAVAYFTLLRPWLYGIPVRIPQLKLGRTVFTTDYRMAQADPVLVALAATMMARLDQFTQARRQNAAALLNALRGVPVTTIAPATEAAPVYLRLPILTTGEREQAAAIQTLTAAGIGATGSYPRSLADVPELRDALADPKPAASGGRDVARRIDTLPTHTFVASADVSRMRRILAGEVPGAMPLRAVPS